MINNAVAYVSSAFGWLIDQVDSIFQAIPGAMDLILGIFAIYVSVRMLLKPMFGGSDGVLKKVKKNSNKSGDADG